LGRGEVVEKEKKAGRSLPCEEGQDGHFYRKICKLMGKKKNAVGDQREEPQTRARGGRKEEQPNQSLGEEKTLSDLKTKKKKNGKKKSPAGCRTRQARVGAAKFRGTTKRPQWGGRRSTLPLETKKKSRSEHAKLREASAKKAILEKHAIAQKQGRNHRHRMATRKRKKWGGKEEDEKNKILGDQRLANGPIPPKQTPGRRRSQRERN